MVNRISLTALAACLGSIPLAAVAGEPDPLAPPRFCSDTAAALFEACRADVQDEFSRARAICINVSGSAARQECLDEAGAARDEGLPRCGQQQAARRQVCARVGDGRYDPSFDPEDFEDDFSDIDHPNRYFPLRIGNRWDYRSATETITVEILNQTKLIEGVTCIVSRDRVFAGADLIENTDDWFAQADDGNVWYCGEEVKNLESFDGDRPRRPELVGIDGSFKAGRDGDKPGIIFPVNPRRGDIHREEFSVGNAEDVAEVLSANYSFGQDPALDQLVPRALARLLCNNDCVVTRNFTPIEPGVFERKFYAPGIGLFLEVTPSTQEVIQLVRCNFDPRCAALPAP